jgi:serine/threonine protein kinase
VVIKVVAKLEVLRRELQLHSRVRDLNVVTLWGTTTLPSAQQALVLEYCEQGDLRGYLSSGTAISPAQRLSLCLDVAWGEWGC